MFLIRWISHWPLGLLQALGAALGWLVWAMSPTYRRRLRANARLAGVDARARRQAIAEAGRMVAETPWLWLHADDADLARLVQWRNPEALDAVVAAHRPFILLTPHMGSFEVAAQAVAQRFAAEFGPITVLYRPARKAALRAVMDESRARPGVATAPATLAGVRLMIRALRRGEAVGLLPDQVPPEGMGVWVPFFGREAYTMTLAARLVQQTGAVPLLIWGERLPRGAGYTVRVSALGETLPTDDPGQAESAAIINRAMAQLIRQCPQQFLWGYNRYKTPRSAD
jgi:KDO2-lipid IV(A) lauroyltransferase